MWTCPKCGERIEDQFDTCWKCGGPGDGSAQTVATPAQTSSGIWRWLLVAIAIAQIVFIFQFSFGYRNLARVRFRQTERYAALKAVQENPTPENKATLENEWKLASRYVGRRQLAFAGFLSVIIFGPEILLLCVLKRVSYRNRSQPLTGDTQQ